VVVIDEQAVLQQGAARVLTGAQASAFLAQELEECCEPLAAEVR
jgi:hypothetical protein